MTYPNRLSAEESFFNRWSSTTAEMNWSAPTDLDHHTHILFIQERCIGDHIYIRFQNHGDAPITVHYAFGTGDTPNTTADRLTLNSNSDSTAVLVPVRQCDAEPNSFHVFFFNAS